MEDGNEDCLRRRLKRSDERVRILERLLEDKSRELYVEHESYRRVSVQLTRLLETLNSAVLVTDSSLKVTMFNSAAISLLRKGAVDLMEAPVESLVGIPNWEWRDSEGKPLFFGPVQREIVLERENDSSVPVLVSISSLADEAGNSTGLVFLIQDFSVRKELERQLFQAQKLEAVGQLAAGVAHEINTPIQYIRDNTMFFRDEFKKLSEILSLFSSKHEATEAGAEFVKANAIAKEIDLDYLLEELPCAIEQSLEGVENVARIVRSMREFSHPGSEEKSLVDLNVALESTLTVCRNEWKYVADAEFLPADDLPLVPCLAGPINQVFLNLIVNAAHAVSDATDGGKKGKGKITIQTQNAAGGVEVIISDTGCGIPEAVKGKVFDPFFTTKKVGKGSGQGLAIAYHAVVDDHGGRLSFDSEVGKGTAFRIFLPVTELE